MSDLDRVRVEIGADGAPAREETEATRKSVVENLREIAEGMKEVEQASQKSGDNVIDMLKRVRSESEQGGGATKGLTDAVKGVGEASAVAETGILAMLAPLAAGALIGVAVGGARELWHFLKNTAEAAKQAAEEMAALNAQAARLGRLADDTNAKDLDAQFGKAAPAVALQRRATGTERALAGQRGRVSKLEEEKAGLYLGIQSEVDFDLARNREAQIDKELDQLRNAPETGIRALENDLRLLKDNLRATVAQADAALARKPAKAEKEERPAKEKDDSPAWEANVTREAAEYQAGIRRAEQYRVDLARIATQGLVEEGRIEAEGAARLAVLQRQYDAETVEANRTLLATVMEQEREAINRKLQLFREGEAARAAADAEALAHRRAREVGAMQQPYLQAAQAIGSAFTNAFTSVGRGAVTAGQAMKNFVVQALQGLIQLGAQLLVTAHMAAIKGAIAAGASAADTPGVGWLLAIPAAAGVLAGLVGMIASAEGGFNIPRGSNPLTQLHQEEMVLPAHIANPLRSALAEGSLGGGGGGGGDTFYANFTNVDARGFKAMLRANSKAVRDFMREERRSGRL